MPGDRLPRLLPGQLDDLQRQLYDSIAGGERAKGTQHFPLTDDDGALHGPFGVMLHAPGVGMPLQHLGAAIRFHTDLSARIREIAILQVAQATASPFEWWAHVRVGRAVGLTDDEITQLSIGCFSSTDPQEAAAARLCGALLRSVTLSDDDFRDLRADLSARQVTELTVLVGYYVTLAQLMNVFGVTAPDDDHADDTPVSHTH